MPMKPLFAAIALVSSIASTWAHAAPVTVQYRVDITGITDRGWDVDSTGFFGFHLTTDDSITGYFSYDTEVPLTHGVADGAREYMYGGFRQWFIFDKHPTLIVPDHDNYVRTYYSGGRNIIAESFDTPGHRGHMFVLFDDPGSGLDGYLPGVDEWDGLSRWSMFSYSYDTGAGWYSVYGYLSDFRVVSVSPVPEPAAGMMLVAGGLALAACRRRARRQP
jgi:hypothetical protein